MPSSVPKASLINESSNTFQEANILHEHGELDQAVRLYRLILSGEPHHFDALHQLGIASLQQGKSDDALDYIGQAVNIKHTDAALSNFGLVLAKQNRLEEALLQYDKALALNPDFAQAHNNRGRVLRDLGRPKASLDSCNRAVALNPSFAEAYNNRANALIDLKRPEEALRSYDHALRLKPDYFDALNNRAKALRDLKRPQEALKSCDKALALRPNFPEAHSNRANVLLDLQRPAEALASCDTALGLKPDDARIRGNRAIILWELGQFDEAGVAAMSAIKLNPRGIRPYYTLAFSTRLITGDPHIAAMEELSRDITAFGPDEQVELYFALGKVFADNKNYDRAFQNLLAGNALKRSTIRYSEPAFLSVLERTRNQFNIERMRSSENLGNPSHIPIFVFGMPRSGTTLVEQILASHPQVYGAGEIDHFARAAFDLCVRDGVPPIVESLSKLSREQLIDLGSSYFGRIADAAPAAARITNKMVENFRWAGLIHNALPNARFIHVRRNPADTCVSCFSTLFNGNLPYTYNLRELGRYYRAYDNLMMHWRRVLPQHIMIDVDYEEVVRDLDGQARRMIAHVGLDWHQQCVDFHLNTRSVRTASAAQVRRPIYSSSIGRWRAYAQHLKPLLNELTLSHSVGLS
jgi:tetratricopeptide (TPR) repeat protein